MIRALLALMIASLAQTAHAEPRRIVSMNPCVDAILHAIAPHTNIAGISHYSQDPSATSVPLAWAKRYPVIGDTAEAVVALRPDLIITSIHTARATRLALERLGVPMLLLGVPGSIAESQQQISQIGAAISADAAASRLNARIDAAADAARTSKPPAQALLRQLSGLVPGKGTLADELMRTAGLRNASADYGLSTWDILPLEYLVARPPAALLVDVQSNPRASRHPVLRRLAAHSAVHEYPDRLLRCGGPTIIPALARLQEIRASL